MVATSSKIELSGNFFTHDPGKTLYRNIGDMLDALALEMQTEVRTDIASHQTEMPGWTGWSRDHAFGYTVSPYTGKAWALWTAVGSVTASMNRTDAIRTKAAAASIERRFHPYRRVKSAVYRARALITADLAKNLE